MTDPLHYAPPAVSPEEHARREAVWAAMGNLLEPLEQRAVLVVFDGTTNEAHVSVHAPGQDEHGVLLTGQQALYALSLYTKRLEQMIEAASGRRPPGDQEARQA